MSVRRRVARSVAALLGLASAPEPAAPAEPLLEPPPDSAALALARDGGDLVFAVRVVFPDACHVLSPPEIERARGEADGRAWRARVTLRSERRDAICAQALTARTARGRLAWDRLEAGPLAIRVLDPGGGTLYTATLAGPF